MAKSIGAARPRGSTWGSGRERFVAFVALGAVVCGGAFYLFQRARTAAPDSVLLAPQDAPSDWPLGQRVRYTMRWASDAEAVGQDPETGLEDREPLSRIHVEATLALTRVQGTQGQTVLSAELLEPRCRSKANGQELQTQDLSREISQPFLIHFERGGRVERVQMPPNLGTTSFSVFKSVASFLQRVAPKKAEPLGQSSWSAVEPDLTGKADFEYRLENDQLKKTKAGLRFARRGERQFERTDSRAERRGSRLEPPPCSR